MQVIILTIMKSNVVSGINLAIGYIFKLGIKSDKRKYCFNLLFI